MDTKRIPCALCGCLILEATSIRNNGLCEPCKIRRNAALREHGKLESIADSAGRIKLLPNKKTSEVDFIKKLILYIGPSLDNHLIVARYFLEYCEPILQERNLLDLLVSNESLAFELLQYIPRPFRELFALYQAWGIIYSDDFSVYASFACKRFDNEVDLGLLKVGHNECAGVLAQARSEFYKKNQVLTPELDSMIWEKFCERLPSFEQNILGFHIAEIIRGIS